MEPRFWCRLESPVGPLRVSGDGSAITEILFERGRGALPPPPEDRRADTPFRDAICQLEAYFAGELETFELPVAPSGTPFQLVVWSRLREIPYGVTISYGELARTIGRAHASRAVGAANGRNPIPIVIPCHRVVGSDGSLTGFGGGIETKRWLLRHEARRRSRNRDLFETS